MSFPFPGDRSDSARSKRSRGGSAWPGRTPRPCLRATFSHETHFQPGMKSGVCPLYSGADTHGW